MKPALEVAMVGVIRAVTSEFISWQQRRMRESGYVPSQEDVDKFIAEIAADSPEAIRKQIAQELGIPWVEPDSQGTPPQNPTPPT